MAVDRGRLRRRLAAGASVGLAATALFAASVAHAAPGDLDPAFSGDGKLITEIGDFASVAGMAIQADGKIVAVGSAGGNFGLARYHPDGSLDTSFSGDGRQTTDFGSGDLPSAVAIQPDGKIVVAGTTGNWLDWTSFALARYNPDGSLDTSFGGGTVETEFLFDYDRDFAMAHGVGIQSGGKIVAAGSASGIASDIALVRYSAGGGIDSSFGVEGRFIGEYESDGAFDMAIQPDGKIVVVGQSDPDGLGNDFMVARFSAGGAPDTSFAGDGKARTNIGGQFDSARAVALQPDGKIVVVGASNDRPALARYGADGSLDSGFGSGGQIVDDADGEAADVAVQPDGKIVVVGTAWGVGGRFALARRNADGSLDAGFSGDGRTITTFGADDAGLAVALQSDGKILAAGGSDGDFALARYLVTGTPHSPGGQQPSSPLAPGGAAKPAEPAPRPGGAATPAVRPACVKARTAQTRLRRQVEQARRKLSATKGKNAKRKLKRTVNRRQAALRKATKRAKRACA
jgi:uncharacterized delta-60 repeat protein